MANTARFEIGRDISSQRVEGRTVRLLLMGDFSGRANRVAANTVPLARRPVVGVDIDSFDEAMKQLAPQVLTTLEDGSEVNWCPQAIADLHPDRIVETDVPLALLMARRQRLLDPASFAGAATEMVVAATDPAPAASVAIGSTGAAPGREDDQSTLSRLLGSSATAAASPRVAAQRAVDALVREVTAGVQRPPALPGQAGYLAAVEELATQRMRRLLHLPAVKSLEAAWRGLHMLVARLELGEELQLKLLDVTIEELRADAAEANGDPSRSSLARRLRLLADEAADATADGTASWLLAGGLYSFGTRDLAVLAAIGAATRDAGMAFVAGADGSLAGTCAEPSQWQAPPAPDLARWQEMRDSGIAAAIGLVAPRFLLRLPYGRATDPIDSFPFEELAGAEPSPHELLWGDAAVAAALVRAGAAGEDALYIGGLPALAFTVDGERRLQPCAEFLMGESVAGRLMEHGLMPLVGYAHRNGVRLAGWRSIRRA